MNVRVFIVDEHGFVNAQQSPNGAMTYYDSGFVNTGYLGVQLPPTVGATSPTTYHIIVSALVTSYVGWELKLEYDRML